MKNHFYIICILFSLLITRANAQDIKTTESGIKTTINKIDVEVKFYSPSYKISKRNR